MNRSPGIFLTAEENPRKPVRPVIALCPNEVGRIVQHARNGKGRKGKGKDVSG